MFQLTRNSKFVQIITQLKHHLNPKLINVSYCHNEAKSLPVSESSLLDKLRQRFPNATSIQVEDTSGGCGAMFNISIETEEFKGLSVMKQHRLVYDLLDEQLKAIHGLHLQTKAPQ